MSEDNFSFDLESFEKATAARHPSTQLSHNTRNKSLVVRLGAKSGSMMIYSTGTFQLLVPAHDLLAFFVLKCLRRE